MEMSGRLQEAINGQIGKELYSGYMYLAMAAWFESKGMDGFSHWMKMQAQEEFAHAMKFYDHLSARGAKVVFGAIDQPPGDFDSPLAVFEETLEHEKKVTGMIEQLYALASEQRDVAATIMLQWFVSEQVEEEKTASGIVDALQMAGDKPQALFMLDARLGGRPAPGTGAGEEGA